MPQGGNELSVCMRINRYVRASSALTRGLLAEIRDTHYPLQRPVYEVCFPFLWYLDTLARGNSSWYVSRAS